MSTTFGRNTMTDTRTFHLTKIDWRWLIVTYCFLVLFHLLPSLLASDFWQFFILKGIWRFVLWAGCGILIVSVYVARRSAWHHHSGAGDCIDALHGDIDSNHVGYPRYSRHRIPARRIACCTSSHSVAGWLFWRSGRRMAADPKREKAVRESSYVTIGTSRGFIQLVSSPSRRFLIHIWNCYPSKTRQISPKSLLLQFTSARVLQTAAAVICSCC